MRTRAASEARIRRMQPPATEEVRRYPYAVHFFNPAGSSLLYSTYLGGTGGDQASRYRQKAEKARKDFAGQGDWPARFRLLEAEILTDEGRRPAIGRVTPQGRIVEFSRGLARGSLPFEIVAIGPDLFRAACDMGLKGLVSKRSDRPYRGGRSLHWIKVKNRQHPATARVKDAFNAKASKTR